MTAGFVYIASAHKEPGYMCGKTATASLVGPPFPTASERHFSRQPLGDMMLVKKFCIRCWRREWFIRTVYGSHRCIRCASLNRVTVL